MANTIHLGVLDANPQELVKKHAGNGKLIFSNGKWLKKERISNDRDIGAFSTPDGSQQYRTKRGIIHYYNDGVHITPARRKNEK